MTRDDGGRSILAFRMSISAPNYVLYGWVSKNDVEKTVFHPASRPDQSSQFQRTQSFERIENRSRAKPFPFRFSQNRTRGRSG